ncbi:IclR family transcriptional regulator [Hoeflea poritis]|uniref:IclR family transcriptional regulator n=1 Tax=Hoeflea poritis TaxID=2993659 RepID=A0ABT4VI68_9HYPH|nr:IclR family transcriptional regulator [Hoeflea poritis]MDA4844385.1 IclR family transcriptional regulator [Hoeflea poritis]
MADSVDGRKTDAPKLDSTLSKGLMILETLTAHRGGKGVTELSKELGLTKSNTFRLLQTLCALGYVRNNRDKTYSATLKTWQIGRAGVENLNLREVSRPAMQHLANETGEVIYLAVPEHLQIVYIDKIDSSDPIRSWNPIGGSAPIHCVGTGKAILAANYGTLRDTVKHNLVRYTDRTITDIEALDADIALTRKRGYAFDTGEFRERGLSFGAALTLPAGEAVAAIGISIPRRKLMDGTEERLGGLVADAAQSVSQRLKLL